MGEKPGLVLNVGYCAKCGGGLTSRSYGEWLTASYETCDCLSCGLTWRIARLQRGNIKIAEVPADEGSPEEFERSCA